MLALRAFEAVARHLSFIKAANELSVTQSALSHQVQKPEQHLGKSLFIRRTRAIDLAGDGQRYYDAISPALGAIAAATRAQCVPLSAKVLRIGLLASFAASWLAPRLAGFLNRYAHIQVALSPAIQLANIAAAEVDLAIRFGYWFIAPQGTTSEAAACFSQWLNAKPATARWRPANTARCC